jgi:hypothetical protein
MGNHPQKEHPGAPQPASFIPKGSRHSGAPLQGFLFYKKWNPMALPWAASGLPRWGADANPGSPTDATPPRTRIGQPSLPTPPRSGKRHHHRSDAPLAEISSPVARSDAPLAETSSPVARSDAPLTETSSPVARSDAPLAETSSPVARSDAPLAEISSPVARSDAPLAEISSPVARSDAPYGALFFQPMATPWDKHS